MHRRKSIVKVALITFGIFCLTEATLRIASNGIPLIYAATWDFSHIENRVTTTEELMAKIKYPLIPGNDYAGFSLNSNGFRTHEYNKEADEGVYRILVLGDSFAFSSGEIPFENVWHEQVKTYLESATEKPIEMINLGVPATGPRFYKRMFELEGTALSPDLTVVSVFIGNDFIDDYGTLLSPYIDINPWLRRSYTWNFLKNMILAGKDLPWILQKAHANEIGTFPKEMFLRIEEKRSRIFQNTFRHQMQNRMKHTIRTFEEIRHLADTHGTELLFILIPDEVQVEQQLQSEVADYARKTTDDYDFDWPSTTLETELNDMNIPVINLLPTMKNHSETLYAKQDTHWNDMGNTVAAKHIAEYILSSE